MKLDLDRLHQVALGEVNHRSCGKTTLKCYNVVGALDVTNDTDIIVIGRDHEYNISFFLTSLLEVLESNDYKYKTIVGNTITLTDNRKIIIVSEKDNLHGFDGYVVE